MATLTTAVEDQEETSGMFGHRIAFAAVLAGSLLGLQSAARAEVRSQDSQLQLAEDVKSLRQAFLQDLHERQVEKVAALEREFEQVHRLTKQLDAALETEEREMAEWTAALQSSELSPEDRAQAEMAKREVSSEGVRKMRAKRAEAVTREGEMFQRLVREKDRLRRLGEALSPQPR